MSYVQIAKHYCPICGEVHETNELLLNTKLKDIPDDVVNGFSLCSEHARLAQEGYVGLVVVSNSEGKSTLNPETAERTGEIIHLKKPQAEALFQAVITVPYLYIDEELYTHILEWSQTECLH